MTEPEQTPLTMSVKEAADLLGMSARWLADQARGDVVPHVRFGRRVRFTRAQVDEILAAHSRGAIRPPNRWGQTDRSRTQNIQPPG